MDRFEVDSEQRLHETQPEFHGLVYTPEWYPTEDDTRHVAISADYWPQGFGSGTPEHLGVGSNRIGQYDQISIEMSEHGAAFEPLIQRAKEALHCIAKECRRQPIGGWPVGIWPASIFEPPSNDAAS